MLCLNSKEVRQLLHNKFVVILGDSIQRSVYKDLIQLLQSDSLLTSSQMKSKGEFSFENDHLIEGGVLDGLHNGIRYREVRQYRTRYHLVRFYFLTRIYSEYFESILGDFRAGPQPDVLILNSCVWDVSRYGSSSMMEYRKNLEVAFNKLDAELSPSCLVIWNMTMPLGPRIKGGFLIPELQHLSQTLRRDIIEGNFYGATLAALHLFDVVDLHFHFRFDVGNRGKDGIHWNNVVHRRITKLLLTHLANAWGVVIPEKNPSGEQRKAIGLLAAPKNIIGHAKSCRRDYEDTDGFLERPTPTTGWLSKERKYLGLESPGRRPCGGVVAGWRSPSSYWGTSGLASKHGEAGAQQTCGQDVVKKVKMAATVEQLELLPFLMDVTLNVRDGLLLASLWPPS
ncbi:PC-esterase domain-containing protein 1A [Pantherophis guttatus]|uniref:PC-esterase domain-containing protein 1A n=1 Tax=Pantherophis guttatus TaxID=94885 RepID=A0ABM3ZIC7_PANGU|nr:PC-esterase domain-containing protein 1A [Pantherophis guttatus]